MMHGPTSAELVQQAQTELVQGHLAASAAFYLRATQADPRNASAFRGLGLVSERLGHTQDAIRALRRAQALSPGDSSNALLEERIRKLEQPR
jgi:Flp pilus assembly protein TadD